MEDKLEEWWAGDYQKLSIKNFKKMSVYLLFIKHSKPFYRENTLFKEAFWIVDNCDIFEWIDLFEKTGEKFGHDRNSDTYFYEYWWVLPEKVRKVRKVWFCNPVEWGVEITYYPDFKKIHQWSVKNGEVLVESSKRFHTHTEGQRFGTVLTPDGTEEFVEDFWEDKERVRTEKNWKNSLGQEFQKVTDELKKGQNGDVRRGFSDDLTGDLLAGFVKDSLKTLQQLNKICGVSENDPSELCGELEKGGESGLMDFGQLGKAETEKQKKLLGLGNMDGLKTTLAGLEAKKLALLENLSEVSGNQDLDSIKDQVAEAVRLLTEGLTDDLASNLDFFKTSDKNLDNLIESALKALIEKESDKIEIAVRTTLEGESLWKGLTNLDSSSSTLLSENINRIKSIDPDLASKSEESGNLINEMPTDTPSNLISRVQSRLDLLKDLEKAALDDLLAKAKDQGAQNESVNKEKEELLKKLKDLQDELNNKQEELLNKDFELKNKEDELRDKEFELEGKNIELDSLKSQLDDKSKSLEEALNTIHLKSCEISEKEHQLKALGGDLNSKLEELQAAKDSISGLSSELQARNEENEKIKDDSQKMSALLESQKAQLETQKQLLENSTDKNSEVFQKIAEEAGKKSKELAEALNELENLKKALESSLSHNSTLESGLKSANDEISSLNSSLSSLKIAHSKAQLRNALKIFRGNQTKLFKRWLSNSKDTEKAVIGFSDDEFDLDDEDDEKELVQEYKAADELILEENKYLIEHNIIMQSYKLIEGKTEKPMSYINIFKFLEELVSSKYETDKKDIKDLRQMRSMTEFMMESLQRKFGIQSLALKFLGQFIPGFFQLYNEGHKYAVYFCRLLQLFHPEPVPYSLSLFLVRVNFEFAQLIEKCDRFMTNHKISLIKNASSTHGRKAYEEASTGGLALVSDVIDYIYTLFAGDRESGTKALEIMKPELVSLEEYVIFRICHKMAKMGVTAETIFNTLDKDGSGSISSKELVIGIKKDLDLWISEGHINKFMEHLDVDRTDTLSIDEFTSRVNMKTFLEWTKKPVWTIAKCSFLVAMIEVYKYNQRKLTAHLNPKFLKYGKNEVDKEIFEEILLSYEPTLSVYDIEKLFTEGIETIPGSKGVNFRSLTLLMSKYGFGSVKSFKIKELMENLAIRKTTVDITLGVTEIGPGGRKRTDSISNEEEKKGPSRLSTSFSKEKIKSPCPPANREPKKLLNEIIDQDSKGKKNNLGLPPLPAVGESPSMIGKKKVTKK